MASGPPRATLEGRALPGDEVEVREGRLWLNGRDGGPCPFPRVDGPPRTGLGPLVVPPGHVYCVGDNRGCSYDSRHWGPLPEEAVQGRVLYTLWPGSGGPRDRWRRLGRRPGPAYPFPFQADSSSNDARRFGPAIARPQRLSLPGRAWG
ncbi:signal peptidase I [Mesoterricola sediminis]|uniref:signal peptidase I n=1 Tax=Mesoterricola sediminis TaxID=2927980 RepID=UPI00374477A5